MDMASTTASIMKAADDICATIWCDERDSAPGTCHYCNIVTSVVSADACSDDDCCTIDVCKDGCVKTLDCGHTTKIRYFVNGDTLHVKCPECDHIQKIYPDKLQRGTSYYDTTTIDEVVTLPVNYRWFYRWSGITKAEHNRRYG